MKLPLTLEELLLRKRDQIGSAKSSSAPPGKAGRVGHDDDRSAPPADERPTTARDAQPSKGGADGPMLSSRIEVPAKA